MGDAGRAGADRARPARPRQQSGRAGAARHQAEASRIARQHRGGDRGSPGAHPGRHAGRGARPHGRQLGARRHRLRPIPRDHGRGGGVRLRGLVRERRVRGADQGGDQGDDPRVAGRGVPLRRHADALFEVRPAGHRGGVVGQGVLAEPFGLADGTLHCESVPLARIADAVGTPAYVYSAAGIREQYRRLDDAFAGVPHRVHYSVKANSSLAVLALLREAGAGVDIVSGGELYRAMMAGYNGADVVFSGVGKTERELDEALAGGVLLINVESEGELLLVDDIARRRASVAPVAIRVNPEVAVHTPHEYTRTGGKGHKFGVAYDDARALAGLAGRLSNVRLLGLDMHIGSQIASFEPFAAGLARLASLLDDIRRDGAPYVEYLDIGGGLAVAYEGEEAADVDKFAAGVSAA